LDTVTQAKLGHGVGEVCLDDGLAPVATGQQRGLGAALADQIADVGGQLGGVVGRDAVRLR
jgi:hypothetical protein